MGMRSGTTFKKRQKEIARMEKQRDKAARRLQRKADKIAGITEPDMDIDNLENPDSDSEISVAAGESTESAGTATAQE